MGAAWLSRSSGCRKYTRNAPRRRLIGCVWAVFGILVILSTATAVGAAWWLSAPDELQALETGPPTQDWATWRRQEERWLRDGVRRPLVHHYVPLERINPAVAHAVLVLEDINFFGHRGVDPGALREAFHEWQRGRPLRGASTITQQLAKSLFLSPERSLRRKIREARLAWWMERRLGKRRILELYLNVVEFGPGTFGVEAASRRYYSVSAAELTRSQAAGLAASIPSPARDNPATGTERWSFRRNLIEERIERSPRLDAILREMFGIPAAAKDTGTPTSSNALVNDAGCL